MKDFVLSLLSRGFGQIVPDESGHNERLEVCFEPEDYFNWKSQPPLLRLTSSGQFFGCVDPVPPKTYSTRRGPLILYSEDLALSYQNGQVNRKRKALSGPKPEVEYQLHTLQDLTGAILAYGKKQPKAGSLSGVTHPLIPDTKHASQHIHMHQRTGEKCYHLSQSKEKGGQVPYQPRFLCSPRPNRATLGPLPPITKGLVHVQSQENTHLTPAETDGQVRHQPSLHCSLQPNRVQSDPLPPITEGLVHVQRQEKSFQKPEEQMSLKMKGQQKPKVNIRHSMMTEADTCRGPMSPIPEITDVQTGPIEQTILPNFNDHPKDLNSHKNLFFVENRSGVEDMCVLRSVYVDSSLESCPLSRLNYYGGCMEGFHSIRHCGYETSVRRVNTETDPSLTISHLPPINTNPTVNPSSDISTLSMNKSKTINMESLETSQQREPKIRTELRTTDVKHPEKSVHSKVLVLLPPQITKTPALHDEMHKTLVEDSRLCGVMEPLEEPPSKGPAPFSDNKCRMIEMDLGHVVWSDAPEKRDKNPPLGPLPPLVGRRGPGKQSSMAVYSQSLQDPSDTEEAQKGNIRGCLPPELRERQAGVEAGTLIMGPDGEIIRLSLWDPAVDTEDHPKKNDVTQGHVLKVVTSKEDLKQPWTILIQDCIADKAGDVTTRNTEATNRKQLDSSQEEGFLANKQAVQTYPRRAKNHLGSHKKKTKKFTINTCTKTNAEEVEQEEDDEQEEDEEEDDEQEEDEEEDDEQKEDVEFQEEEDYLSSDSEVCDKAQVILVHARAKRNNATDDENHFGSDNEIFQEAQVFKVSSRVKQTNAKRKKKHDGSDGEIIQESQVVKVNSHGKQRKAKRNEKYLGPDDEIIQEGQAFKNNSYVKQTNRKKRIYLDSDNEINQNEEVGLPEENIEHMRSTTHKPGRQGEGTTAVQRNKKGKTTTLQPETGVTLGSRKSKGAAPAINPKSTQFSPTTDTQEQNLSPQGWAEIHTGTPMEAAFDRKGYSKSTGGTEEADHKYVESVKKNKKIKKQTSKSKRKTVEIHKDDETQNSTVFEDNTATSKHKKKKTKEMTEEEKEEPTEFQNTKVKTKKKKKGQPVFVVGKPRAQEVKLRKANPVDESKRETYEEESYGRETFENESYEGEMPSHNTDDDELDNSTSQEPNYNDSEDDIDSDTDSVCTEVHEAQNPSRSVYSSHRSHYSQFTAQSHPSTHSLSQSSHRTSSVGVVARHGPCSPAPLSLIHLPPQTAQRLASDPSKSESGHSVKSNEEPNPGKQVDTKAAALAERTERRRLEMERKRKEKEEEKKRQQEKEATEDKMKTELEEEQKKRGEDARLKKIREEEERQRRQQEEMERQRREEAEKERERRRQEEKKRLMERLQRERQEEEKRQAAELERKRLEEKVREEEERMKLSGMEEAERLEYLRRRKEEEEERRKAAEERKRRDEEAAMRVEEEARLQTELFSRQRTALEQQLKFHRGLFVEAGGLEQTQDISRPWVFSYFALLKMLGLADPTSAREDALTDVL